MNIALELHDSTLTKIIIKDSMATICLSNAIVHKSEGIPGQDDGTCWEQKINIVLSNAIFKKNPRRYPK